MDKIINIQNLDPQTLELQTYSDEDQNLISSFDLENSFSSSIDYIEYSIYDLNQNLLLYQNNFTNYSILDGTLQLNPENDLSSYGFTEGQYITNYNFLRNILGSNSTIKYYISEISSDRTEIRLDTTSIPNDLVIDEVNNYKIQLEQSNYYKDFYINFSNNNLVIANNILLDVSNPNNPTVLIKLYEPLPSQFDLKSELWVVEFISSPVSYQIDISLIFNNLDENIYLQGPNFNIDIKDQVNNSTEFTNLNLLTNTTSQYGTSSLKYQLNSILDEKGANINIDYTDYSNFIFFSSAKTRLENFYYKISLIEEYNLSSQIITGSATSSYYISSSFDLYQAKINDIITKFDNYEYFLYFESGSKCWPKTNDDLPYINASPTSSQVLTWLSEQYQSASIYDIDLNPNNLINTIPSYLRDDPNNSQYMLFVEMIGQHFDSIWVYIKDITNKYNADNRLDYGVSKDLISDVLKDLGLKIYQNNFSTSDLYSSFLGFTPSGSLILSPEGEVITNYISASIGPYVLPGYVLLGYSSGNPIVVPTSDLNASIYKRIYHNMPYLLKKKGTVEGLKALITIYGIPDTILNVNEFGGKNKDNSNDWDQWQDIYNYTFNTEGDNYLLSSFQLNNKWEAPNDAVGSLTFKFKPSSLPTSSMSQSLWGSEDKSLIINYTGSGLNSGSYSGSSTNPYNQYAQLIFFPDSSVKTISASIYLPFYNGDWWSVMLTSGSGGFNLIAKNKIYDGEDGNQIGFQSSSSISTPGITWNSANSFLGFNALAPIFNGLYQELRYYSIPLTQDTFDQYVVNPYSIEQSEYLAFRAPLGGELYTGSVSIHPKVTGSWIPTSSFTSNSNFSFYKTPRFDSNVENIFLNQPPAGIRNIVNNKIKIAQNVVTSGNTLSPYIRLQRNSTNDETYTKDLNLLEVTLSPQNEINQNIMSQLGYFNLGQYIGDPRDISQPTTSYPDLDVLRNEYFKKYTHNYDLTDYIRLIKFFDNSLFKLIRDFTPARTSLASGIVIKQHLLERNKYRVPSASYSEPYYTGSVKSFPFDFKSSQLYKTSGGDAGEFNSIYISNLTQSWSESIVTPLGLTNRIHNDRSEFLTGELSGSTIIATTQSLGQIPEPFKLNLLESNLGVNIPLSNYYDIPFDFKSDKMYYIQFSTYNADPTYIGQIAVIWANAGLPAIYSNDTIPSGDTVSSFIKIENAKSKTLRILNSSFLNTNIFVSVYIYEIIDTQYNPLLNNVILSRLSTKYFDVDYSYGQSIPTNQNVILNGTADKAPVQDYNWDVRRSTLPRYQGSKNSSLNYNIYNGPVNFDSGNTSSFGYTGSWDGDVSYGKTAAIDLYQTYFLTFKEIRNTYPELVNKSTLWINSLVDENGNELSVTQDTGSTYYYNLIDNFGKNSVVNLQVTTIPSSSNSIIDLDQTTTVYRPALLWPRVILTNETGSKQLSLTQVSFEVKDLNISVTSGSYSDNIILPKHLLTASFGISGGDRILTASVALRELWYSCSFENYIGIQNTTFEGYGGRGGYDPAIPFNLKAGQEIRFDQREDQSYIITNVYPESFGPTAPLIIEIDRDLDQAIAAKLFSDTPPGILIRENIVDPSKLVVNAPKLVGGSPGYMTPQYMSPKLINSLNKTVETLKENGVL
jgi:hypothetical protein